MDNTTNTANITETENQQQIEQKERLRFAGHYYEGENNFKQLKYKLVTPQESNLIIPIFDRNSNSELSGIVPVNKDYVAVVTGYGFDACANPLISIEDLIADATAKAGGPYKTKQVILDEIHKLTHNVGVDIPVDIIKTIDPKIDSSSNIVKILEGINNLENKAIDFLIEPVYLLIKLVVNVKDKVIAPFAQTVINLLEPTWIGKLLHNLFNVATQRPLNEIIAYRAIPIDDQIEINKCISYSNCCTDQYNYVTNNIDIPKFKIVPEYLTQVNGFRVNYATNVANIVTPGYYVFRINCLNYTNITYVNVTYINRKDFVYIPTIQTF